MALCMRSVARNRGRPRFLRFTAPFITSLWTGIVREAPADPLRPTASFPGRIRFSPCDPGNKWAVPIGSPSPAKMASYIASERNSRSVWAPVWSSLSRRLLGMPILRAEVLDCIVGWGLMSIHARIQRALIILAMFLCLIPVVWRPLRSAVFVGTDGMPLDQMPAYLPCELCGSHAMRHLGGEFHCLSCGYRYWPYGRGDAEFVEYPD